MVNAPCPPPSYSASGCRTSKDTNSPIPSLQKSKIIDNLTRDPIRHPSSFDCISHPPPRTSHCRKNARTNDGGICGKYLFGSAMGQMRLTMCAVLRGARTFTPVSPASHYRHSLSMMSLWPHIHCEYPHSGMLFARI